MGKKVEAVVLCPYTWGLKDKCAEDFLVHFCYTFTRLKSLVRTLYQEATTKTGFPLRKRIKKKEKKAKENPCGIHKNTCTLKTKSVHVC